MTKSAYEIKQGPSVDAIRAKSTDGVVKANQILPHGENRRQLTVEEAREAMIAAGEAPKGDKNEALSASRPKPKDERNRWERGPEQKSSQTSSVPSDMKHKWEKKSRSANLADERMNRFRKLDALKNGEELPEYSEVSDKVFSESEPDSGYDVHIATSDGQVWDFQVHDKPSLIRELKKFNNQFEYSNGKLPVHKRLKAEISYTPINPSPLENAATITINKEASTQVSPTDASQTSRGEGGSTRTEPQIERMENSKFTLEIFQEDGEWVGRITYKNGAGTEEFHADTRRALDMKILEGKAHATLKVREVLRRDQFHDDLDQRYDIQGYSQEAFDALTPEVQGLVIDAIASQGALAFRETTPEFYGSPFNTKTLTAFLHKRNLPITLKNLKYAFGEVFDDLEVRPQAKQFVQETPAQSAPPAVVDSTPKPATPVVTSVTPAPAAPVAEVRKRGSFGFKPGYTSTGSTELEETEGGKKSTELSEKEARTMDMNELAQLVRKGYNRDRRF